MTNEHFSICDQKSLPQNGEWTLTKMDTGDLGHPLLQHFLNPKSQRLLQKNKHQNKWKVGIKIKNPLGGICPSSVPSKYLFLCARRKFGFNKKICRKLLIVYMYYQQNSCTTPMEHGLEDPSKTAEKEFLQPTRSKFTWRNIVREAHTGLMSLSVILSVCNEYQNT
jgi:hypothetical protein